jgi:alpha-beta hydrolase superfamily lysophospholipase
VSSAGRPLYVDGAFGWLHGSVGKRAALICPALGAEYLVLHRFVRRLAVELADAGIPAMRLDYPGTGDSADLDNAAGDAEVDAWLEAIRRGVRATRILTGATDVVLVGFQVGALLAACAARDVPEVSGLALIAPVANGRSYIRELKLRASVQRSGAAAPQDGTDPSGGGLLEINGYAFPEPLRLALKPLDAVAPPVLRHLDYLVLGLPNWEADNRLVAALHSEGRRVTHGELPGLGDFKWHSTFAALPSGAYHDLVEWCRRLPVVPDTRDVVRQAPHAELHGASFTEKPGFFGPNSGLFGIYCRPNGPMRGNLCVIIGNHGANHHVGWGSMYVPMARELARLGIASFRFDFAGIGDSPSASGEPGPSLYSAASQEDTRAAVDHIASTYGHSVMLLGHCSGAFQAFYSAVADERVRAIVMTNLATFHWKPGDSLEEAERKSSRTMGWYARNLFRYDTLSRLVRGRIDVAHVLRAMGRWLAMRLRRLAPAGGRAGSGEPPVLAHFAALSARGTKALLVYSDNDSGLDELSLRGGRRITSLPNVSIRILRGADHNVSARVCRSDYFDAVCAFATGIAAETTGTGERRA